MNLTLSCDDRAKKEKNNIVNRDSAAQHPFFPGSRHIYCRDWHNTSQTASANSILWQQRHCLS